MNNENDVCPNCGHGICLCSVDCIGTETKTAFVPDVKSAYREIKRVFNACGDGTAELDAGWVMAVCTKAMEALTEGVAAPTPALAPSEQSAQSTGSRMVAPPPPVFTEIGSVPPVATTNEAMYFEAAFRRMKDIGDYTENAELGSLCCVLEVMIKELRRTAGEVGK